MILLKGPGATVVQALDSGADVVKHYDGATWLFDGRLGLQIDPLHLIDKAAMLRFESVESCPLPVAFGAAGKALQ